MYRLLLVGVDVDHNRDLEKVLQDDERVVCAHAGAGRTALIELEKHPVDLVISAEQLPDMTGIEFANQLVRLNPLINCALVSTLSAKDFHEASEGLGILAQLPPAPSESEVMALLQKLALLQPPGR